MPFASQKQRSYLYSRKPGVAKKLAKHVRGDKKKGGRRFHPINRVPKDGRKLY